MSGTAQPAELGKQEVWLQKEVGQKRPQGPESLQLFSGGTREPGKGVRQSPGPFRWEFLSCVSGR